MQEEKYLNSLFYPLIKREALSAFIGVSALYIMDEYFFYGLALALVFFLTLLRFSKNTKKTMLFLLVFAYLSLQFHQNKSERPVYIPSKDNGKALVKSLLPRNNGIAVILQDKNAVYRLTHKNNDSPPPMPGDSIEYFAKWYSIHPPTIPGTFDTKSWLKSQKLNAYGELKDFKILCSKKTPEYYFYTFKKWMLSRLRAYASPAEAGMLLGLLAGDRSGIPETLQNNFRRTGLVHVLAISGFHVVLLSEILLLILKAFRLSHLSAKLIAFILLLVYIPVTGASPAVSRAVLMFIVVQSGSFFNKKADALNILGFALLILVFINPDELWNPGFQLSAAATAGIIIGQSLKLIQKINFKNFLFKSLKTHLIEPSFVTLCATVFTAPFLIYHFQTLSPIAWLGNLIIVPLIAFAMQAGLFDLLLPISYIEAPLVETSTFFLRLASYLTQILSDSPNASVTVGPYSTPTLCLFSVLLILSPAIWKNKSARWCFLILCLIASVSFFSNSALHKLNPSWKITVLDVGQAECIVLQTPSKRTYIIDAGVLQKRNPATEKIIPYLRNQGIQEIEALIITHGDADHYGGASLLLKMFPVKALWMSECSRIEDKKEWQETVASALDQEVLVKDLKRGDVIREEIPRFIFQKKEYFEMKVLHPNPFLCRDANTESITMHVKGLGRSILLTGDLTEKGETDILNTDIQIQSDLLKVGHHGSKTSSQTRFLEAIKPQHALISSGRNNRFRHPSKIVTDRLEALKIPYLNTAYEGSLFVEFSRDSIKISTALHP